MWIDVTQSIRCGFLCTVAATREYCTALLSSRTRPYGRRALTTLTRYCTKHTLFSIWLFFCNTHTNTHIHTRTHEQHTHEHDIPTRPSSPVCIARRPSSTCFSQYARADASTTGEVLVFFLPPLLPTASLS